MNKWSTPATFFARLVGNEPLEDGDINHMSLPSRNKMQIRTLWYEAEHATFENCLQTSVQRRAICFFKPFQYGDRL